MSAILLLLLVVRRPDRQFFVGQKTLRDDIRAVLVEVAASLFQ
jgi:hypothetical protein